MNNTTLATALLTLITTASYADMQPTTPNNTPETKPTAPTTAQPTTLQPVPTPAQPQPAPVIDCKYHIPAETTNIDQATISTWAGKAAMQSFDFNPASIEDELNVLKLCYTDQGWQGFNDALQKSGNISAIKAQHLTVSSHVDGEIKINSVKDNQWKASVPMQVVYQNDKEKLTQLLSVDLLIGRKISGDLGIMQMIATPRPTSNPTTTAPAAQINHQEPPTNTATEQAPPTSTGQPTQANPTANNAKEPAGSKQPPLSTPNP